MANVKFQTAFVATIHIASCVLLRTANSLSTLLLSIMEIAFQLHLVKPAVVLPSAHTQMVLRVMGSHALPANVLQH
jgi:hypothetical protein